MLSPLTAAALRFGVTAARRAATTSSLKAGPVERLITARVSAALQPTHLEVVNESQPRVQESHFKLLVVAAAFEGVPLLRRHRLVNDAIRGGEPELPCHALSVKALTPAQHSQGEGMQTTPKCGA